jgi:hypothetical protein
MVLEEFNDSVIPRPGQRCDTTRGVIKAYTFLLPGLLLTRGEGGACISRI